MLCHQIIWCNSISMNRICDANKNHAKTSLPSWPRSVCSVLDVVASWSGTTSFSLRFVAMPIIFLFANSSIRTKINSTHSTPSSSQSRRLFPFRGRSLEGRVLPLPSLYFSRRPSSLSLSFCHPLKCYLLLAVCQSPAGRHPVNSLRGSLPAAECKSLLWSNVAPLARLGD